MASPAPDLVIGSDPERLERLFALFPNSSLTWWKSVEADSQSEADWGERLRYVIADVSQSDQAELKAALDRVRQQLARFHPERFFLAPDSHTPPIAGWEVVSAIPQPVARPPLTLDDQKDQLLEQAVDILDRWRSTPPIPAPPDRRADFLLRAKDKILTANPFGRGETEADPSAVCAQAYDAALFHHYWRVDAGHPSGAWQLPLDFDERVKTYAAIRTGLRVKASPGVLLAALVILFERVPEGDLAPVPVRPVFSLSPSDTHRLAITLHTDRNRLLDPSRHGVDLNTFLNEDGWRIEIPTGRENSHGLTFSLPLVPSSRPDASSPA